MWAGTWARFGAPLRSLSPPVSRDQTLVRVHAARFPPLFCSRNSTMSARIALAQTQTQPVTCFAEVRKGVSDRTPVRTKESQFNQ